MLVNWVNFQPTEKFKQQKNSDNEFPDKGAFYRLGTKTQFATKVMEFCQGKSDHTDIIEMCDLVLAKASDKETTDDVDQILGEVYLFKSGRYYKIGKTNDTVRRGSELRIQLPEKMDLIHSIKTDDPSGIESYWHKSFESKRMNGEWFDLTSADIKIFKRWKRIY